MEIRAPAKINLNLSVTGKRDDGYHLLKSDIVFTAWGDDITITPADTLQFTVEGTYADVFDEMSVDRDSSNLIIKAVYLMADRAGRDPNIHVHLIKNIPAGAGLAGGSSDAAAVMKALNEMWAMNLSLDELCAMGLILGAELPVCLHAPHACHISGIGEIIEPIQTEKYYLLIVWPDKTLVTKDVFARYQGEVHDDNDLTAAAMSLCPEIKSLIAQLNVCEGCQKAQMSGSGSACFGIFDTRQSAEMAAVNFKNTIVTETY